MPLGILGYDDKYLGGVEKVMKLPNTIEVIEREYSEFDISVSEWRNKEKPHGISGMFRLKNEAEFMEWAIKSHMPWLDEAVLIVQESEDATVEIAYQLQNVYGEKIKIFEYPFNVTQIASKDHFDKPTNSVYHFVHLTNYGLSKCSYSHIAKIEGDVIAMPTFQHIRDLVDLNPEARRYYGRVGFNIAGEEMTHFSYTNPRNAGWDEAVFNNDPFFHCIRYDKWESINMQDFRHIPGIMENPGWSFIHTKRCKKNANQGTERWEPLDKDVIIKALENYGKSSPYPGNDNFADDSLFDWITNNALLSRGAAYV